MMLHILPRGVSYGYLALQPNKALLQTTLIPGQDLQITTVDGFAHTLSINGVKRLSAGHGRLRRIRHSWDFAFFWSEEMKVKVTKKASQEAGTVQCLALTCSRNP
ncbi:hypothetical protein ACLOJK_020679 [Asimina triloba]